MTRYYYQTIKTGLLHHYCQLFFRIVIQLNKSDTKTSYLHLFAGNDAILEEIFEVRIVMIRFCISALASVQKINTTAVGRICLSPFTELSYIPEERGNVVNELRMI